MKNWLMDRLREPSTYAGLSAFAYGVGTLGKINEAPAVAHAIDAAGGALSGGQWGVGLATLIGGVFAAFMKEKGGS